LVDSPELERARDRRESWIWLILAGVGTVTELRFGFVEGMHFAPGRMIASSIETIIVTVVLMALIPFAVKVNRELGFPGGPLIVANINGDDAPYRWTEVFRDAVVWTFILAIVSVPEIAIHVIQELLKTGVQEKAHRPNAPIVMPATGWLVFSAMAGSIGAGVREEILFRLVLMAVFSWVLVSLKDNVDRRPTKGQLWLVTVLQGYCFGFSHLVRGSPLVKGVSGVSGYAARALVLPQTWLGMVFGRLYLKRGLETSIAAHIMFDLLLELGFTALVIGLRHLGVVTPK
jgi:membrane protease YdiL (CAAX protease family)